MSCSVSNLIDAIKSALATKQIGQPVSIRLRLVAPSDFIPVAVNELMQLIEAILPGFEGEDLASGRYRVTQHSSGLQTSVMMLSGKGPSVSLTWILSGAQPASLKLLLIGNHGVIRLEEPLEGGWKVDSADSSEVDWHERFQNTISHPQPVPFK
ncbi:hypothetical protein Pla110_38590 [Polystyrenella longa]|uniref:Uncharacterized protein n=1 Tax=Polystyrenella longa TaxID=2528007 RepID=A0A518CSD8_9PLAN|nr:hypothetical protein [Polystyrenella longa]QDU82104.1 hypothetical protein Pla110_38590 [Polystyrenella longa]